MSPRHLRHFIITKKHRRNDQSRPATLSRVQSFKQFRAQFRLGQVKNHAQTVCESQDYMFEIVHHMPAYEILVFMACA